MKEFILSPLPLADLESMIRRCVKEEFILSEGNTKTDTKEDEFLTIQEAADFLKVSLVSIHNWKRDKDLAYYRVGRSIRFLKKDLIAFAEVRSRKKG